VRVSGHVVLVDQGQWGIGADLSGRRVTSFPDYADEAAACGVDDHMAIKQFERLRSEADAIAFVWPHLWWPECYPTFTDHICKSASSVWSDDVAAIYSWAKSKP